MSKVLIIGATGYLGGVLAASLLRSGNYKVYGLARTPSAATRLAGLEIIPVIGSATDSTAYINLIHSAHIDVVVDVCGAHQDGHKILTDVKAAGAERLRRATENGVPGGGPKLSFVYTSGIWVHGKVALGEVVNDLDELPIGKGAEKVPPLVQWRGGLEKEVLAASDVLDVAVARPGIIYGGSSWIWNSYFNVLQAAADAESKLETGTQPNAVQLKMDAESRVSTVHVEDAAAGLHGLVDRVAGLQAGGIWPVFDLVGSVEDLGAMMTLAARAMGVKGRIEFVDPSSDLLAQALSGAQTLSSGRARTLLGWMAKKPGMLAQMETYVSAWKAHKA